MTIAINKYASELEQVWDFINWNRKFTATPSFAELTEVFNSYDLQSVYQAQNYFYQYQNLEEEESSEDENVMIVRSAYLFSDSTGKKIGVVETFVY